MGSIPALHKQGVEAHTYDPSTEAVEAEGPEFQGHFQLHKDFKVSLGYYDFVLKNKRVVGQMVKEWKCWPLPSRMTRLRPLGAKWWKERAGSSKLSSKHPHTLLRTHTNTHVGARV